MFKKPFKVKSNTQIKSSERKNLKDNLLRKYPFLSETDLEVVFPKKEVIVCSKLMTAAEKHVLVYSVQKRAMIFNVDSVYFPTVYLLWQLPQIGVIFTTNSYVLSKIMHGADLMVPGVINKPENQEHFLAKQVAVINSIDNRAAVAVGVTAMSSTEIKQASAGKCVIVYHCFGDKLCLMDDMPLLPMPKLGTLYTKFEIDDNSDFPELTPSKATTEDDSAISSATCSSAIFATTSTDIPSTSADVTTTSSDVDVSEELVLDEVGEMDYLLRQCFMTAIKYSKTLELPMLTSAFYKMEVLPNCPEGKMLDIKKSSYKKVGQFLKAMEKDGLIVIKEKKKGVETIEDINRQNPTFMHFYVEIGSRPKKVDGEDGVDSKDRSIVESYLVTPAVIGIFKEVGLHKGDSVQAGDVRKHVTSYVKARNLQDETNKKLVKLNDPILSNLCKKAEVISWEDLIEKVTASMKSCFKITEGETEKVNKGKIQPIAISVQTRSGNKKVTIVDNLELYNIRMSEFAKECQHGVAASTSVSRPAGKKSDQILIQGNQVLFVFNLLTDKYKIPKKYIKGLENAPKKK